MPTRSLRLLFRMNWPDGTVSRFFDGSGPIVIAGQVWRGAALVTAVDALQNAINGNAAALNITLSGVARDAGDKAWAAYQAGNIVGATLTILIQSCGADDQPTADPLTVFTGRVDNVVFEDTVQNDQPVANVTVQVANKFTLRRLANGAVLSDADQRARSAVLNPAAAADHPDRFAERVPLMQSKTVVWPRFS